MTAHPLRRFRARKKLSQSELAKLLGTTATTIHRWEKGINIPKRSDWAKIAELTGVKPAELASFDRKVA